MNWEVAGAIGEILSAVAVVVTLYYLAVQMRETRLQAQADNTTQSVDRWLHAQVRMLETEESVSLIRNALNRYDDLSPDQQGLFTGYMFELNAAYQAVLNLNERRLLDSRQFLAMQEAMAAYMICPGAAAWWKQTSQRMPQHIIANIQQICDDYDGLPFTELLSFYKVDVGDV